MTSCFNKNPILLEQIMFHNSKHVRNTISGYLRTISVILQFLQYRSITYKKGKGTHVASVYIIIIVDIKEQKLKDRPVRCSYIKRAVRQ